MAFAANIHFISCYLENMIDTGGAEPRDVVAASVFVDASSVASPGLGSSNQRKMRDGGEALGTTAAPLLSTRGTMTTRCSDIFRLHVA